MCQGTYKSYGMHGHHNTICLCGRNFLTKEEKIEKLENYKKMLENEIKGIEETIEEIKKAS
jgi:hypothetical protein